MRLGEYELHEEIGRGGMGVVFRARPLHGGDPVAVKVLPAERGADPVRRQRFLREARAEAAINDPHIAAFVELGEAETAAPELLGDLTRSGGTARVVFLVIEHVPGEDLRARLAGGPLATADAVEIARQIACGLDAAHRAGVVHRDLKPGNVRITPSGTVKLLDFGLAKVIHSDQTLELRRRTVLTAPGMILGSAPYMAPEQVRGESVGPPADLFALGVLTYEMLAGRAPFGGQNFVAALQSIVGGEPEPLAKVAAGVPRELAGLVERLLAKRPEQRPVSARAVADELALLAVKLDQRSAPEAENRGGLDCTVLDLLRAAERREK